MIAAGGAATTPLARTTGGNHAQAGATVVGSRRAALGQAGPHPLRRGTAARATGARRHRTTHQENTVPDPEHWIYDADGGHDADPYPWWTWLAACAAIGAGFGLLTATAVGVFYALRWIVT